MKTIEYKIVSTASGKIALCMMDEEGVAVLYKGSIQRCRELVREIKSGERDILGNKLLETVKVEVDA